MKQFILGPFWRSKVQPPRLYWRRHFRCSEPQHQWWPRRNWGLKIFRKGQVKQMKHGICIQIFTGSKINPCGTWVSGLSYTAFSIHGFCAVNSINCLLHDTRCCKISLPMADIQNPRWDHCSSLSPFSRTSHCRLPYSGPVAQETLPSHREMVIRE